MSGFDIADLLNRERKDGSSRPKGFGGKQRNLAKPVKPIFEGISVSEAMRRNSDSTTNSMKLAALEADDVSLGSVRDMATVPSIAEGPGLMSLVARLRPGGSSTKKETDDRIGELPNKKNLQSRAEPVIMKDIQQSSGTFTADGSSRSGSSPETPSKSKNTRSIRGLTSPSPSSTNRRGSQSTWGRDSFGLFRGGNVSELIKMNDAAKPQALDDDDAFFEAMDNDDSQRSASSLPSVASASLAPPSEAPSTLTPDRGKRKLALKGKEKARARRAQQRRSSRGEPGSPEKSKSALPPASQELGWIPIVPTGLEAKSTANVAGSSDDEDISDSESVGRPLSKEAQKVQDVMMQQQAALAAALSQTVHSVESLDMQSLVTLEEDAKQEIKKKEKEWHTFDEGRQKNRAIIDDGNGSSSDEDEGNRPSSKEAQNLQAATQKQKQQVRSAIGATPDASEAVVIKSEAMMSKEESDAMKRSKEGWLKLVDDNDVRRHSKDIENDSIDDASSDTDPKRRPMSKEAWKLESATRKQQSHVRAAIRQTEDATESLEMRSEESNRQSDHIQKEQWHDITSDPARLHSHLVDEDRAYRSDEDESPTKARKSGPDAALARRLQAMTTPADAALQDPSIDSMPSLANITVQTGDTSIGADIHKNRHMVQTAMGTATIVEDGHYSRKDEPVMKIRPRLSDTLEKGKKDALDLSLHSGDSSMGESYLINDGPSKLSGAGINIRVFKEAPDRKPDKAKSKPTSETSGKGQLKISSQGRNNKDSKKSPKKSNKPSQKKDAPFDWHRVSVSQPSESKGKYKAKENTTAPKSEKQPSKSKGNYDLPESKLATDMDLPMATGDWKGIQISRKENDDLYSQGSGSGDDSENQGQSSGANAMKSPGNKERGQTSSSGGSTSATGPNQHPGDSADEKMHKGNQPGGVPNSTSRQESRKNLDKRDKGKDARGGGKTDKERGKQTNSATRISDRGQETPQQQEKDISSKEAPEEEAGAKNSFFGGQTHDPFSARPDIGPFAHRPPEAGPFAIRPDAMSPFAVRPPEAGPFAIRPATSAGDMKELDSAGIPGQTAASIRSVGSLESSERSDASASPSTQSVDRHIVRESSRRRLLRQKVEDKRSSLEKMVHNTTKQSFSSDNELLDLKRKLALSQALVEQLEVENAEIQRQAVLDVARVQLALLEQRSNREKELEKQIKDLMAERNAAVDECHHLRLLIVESCPMCRKRLENKAYVMDNSVRHTIISRRPIPPTSSFQWFSEDTLATMPTPSEATVSDLQRTGVAFSVLRDSGRLGRLAGVDTDFISVDTSIQDAPSVSGHVPTFTEAPMQWLSGRLFKKDGSDGADQVKDDAPAIEQVITYERNSASRASSELASKEAKMENSKSSVSKLKHAASEEDETATTVEAGAIQGTRDEKESSTVAEAVIGRDGTTQDCASGKPGIVDSGPVPGTTHNEDDIGSCAKPGTLVEHYDSENREASTSRPDSLPAQEESRKDESGRLGKNKKLFSSLFGERVEDEFEGIGVEGFNPSDAAESRPQQSGSRFSFLKGLQRERVEEDAVFAGVEHKLAMLQDSNKIEAVKRQQPPTVQSTGLKLKNEKVMDDMEILNSLMNSNRQDNIREPGQFSSVPKNNSQAPTKKKGLFGLRSEKFDEDLRDSRILGDMPKNGEPMIRKHNIHRPNPNSQKHDQPKKKRGLFGLRNEKFDSDDHDDKILSLLMESNHKRAPQNSVSPVNGTTIASPTDRDGGKKKLSARLGLKGEKVQDDLAFLNASPSKVAAPPLPGFGSPFAGADSSPRKRLGTNKGRRGSTAVNYRNMLASAGSMRQMPTLNDSSPPKTSGETGNTENLGSGGDEAEIGSSPLSGTEFQSAGNFAPIESEMEERPWRVSGQKPSISRHIESSKTLEEESSLAEESIGDVSDLNHLASLMERENAWS